MKVAPAYSGKSALPCRATTYIHHTKRWRTTVQLEDFEPQDNVDKAVVRPDNIKLVTLSDLVPTFPGAKSQEISKYLFEQPSYNKEWFNILFDAKAMKRKADRQQEYLEKVEKGEIFTEETLYEKVQAWSVYNDPVPALKILKEEYATRSWFQQQQDEITESAVYYVGTAWGKVSWGIYYNWMRYWPIISNTVWAVSRGRLLRLGLPQTRQQDGNKEQFTVFYALKYRFKYFTETEVQKFARQFYQFVDYRSAIATIALGSYTFGVMSYLHSYNQAEQQRQQKFQQVGAFSSVLISKQAQQNHADLVEEGIKAIHESGQVRNSPSFGAYAEPVERKMQYKFAVKEQGVTTQTLLYYMRHGVIRTRVPKYELIQLKPFNRASGITFTETGGVPITLNTKGPSPAETLTPEIKLYDDNKFYIYKTFDIVSVRFGNKYAPRKDDTQEFGPNEKPGTLFEVPADSYNKDFAEPFVTLRADQKATLTRLGQTPAEVLRNLKQELEDPTFVKRAVEQEEELSVTVDGEDTEPTLIAGTYSTGGVTPHTELEPTDEDEETGEITTTRAEKSRSYTFEGQDTDEDEEEDAEKSVQEEKPVETQTFGFDSMATGPMRQYEALTRKTTAELSKLIESTDKLVAERGYELDGAEQSYYNRMKIEEKVAQDKEEAAEKAAHRTFVNYLAASLNTRIGETLPYVKAGELPPQFVAPRTTPQGPPADTLFANADESWATGGTDRPIEIDAKSGLVGVNTGLLRVTGWALPTTQLSHPLFSVRDAANLVDPDLGQYKVHFEEMEKTLGVDTLWSSRNNTQESDDTDEEWELAKERRAKRRNSTVNDYTDVDDDEYEEDVDEAVITDMYDANEVDLRDEDIEEELEEDEDDLEDDGGVEDELDEDTASELNEEIEAQDVLTSETVENMNSSEDSESIAESDDEMDDDDEVEDAIELVEGDILFDEMDDSEKDESPESDEEASAETDDENETETARAEKDADEKPVNPNENDEVVDAEASSETEFESDEENDDTEKFHEPADPGFAAAYEEAGLNQATVAADAHFGEELTGLSYTEAKLFAEGETETKSGVHERRMFIHGTRESANRSLTSTSFESEDTLTTAFANCSLSFIRFSQEHAVLVYPVVGIYLMRRCIRHQTQRIARGRHRKNTETHTYYTHVGRSTQSAHFADFMAQEGTTRQMRELISALLRVRGFTETYRPGILVNFWEIDVLPLIPYSVRSVFLPPEGKIYRVCKTVYNRLLPMKFVPKKALKGKVPAQAFWSSAAIRGLYGQDRWTEDPAFETSLEVFEAIEYLGETIAPTRDAKGVQTNAVSRYVHTQAHKNPAVTIEKIERHFPVVIGAALKVQNLWDHTPLLAAIRPGKYTVAALPRGLLLIGESGNGRTLMARAIATESGLPLMVTEGMRFLHQQWGSFRLRSLFYRARLHYPCILYIKNLEMITLHRGMFSDPLSVRNVTQFLICFDGLIERKNTYVRQPFMIGAVRTSKYMDPACVRSGRFEWAIKFDHPNARQRYALLNTALTKTGHPAKKDVSMAFFALTTFGYSAQEVSQMLGVSSLTAMANADGKKHYEHSNESMTKAVNSFNRLISKQESRSLTRSKYTSDIFAKGFLARKTAREEASTFSQNLSATMMGRDLVPFETKWVHMALETAPQSDFVSNPLYPVGRQGEHTSATSAVVSPEVRSGSEPKESTSRLAVVANEGNVVSFTKDNVYYASASALMAWGSADLLSEMAFFKQINRAVEGDFLGLRADGIFACYDTYSHELGEQVAECFLSKTAYTGLDRLTAGLCSEHPESRLMSHFRLINQHDRTSVGVENTWTITKKSSLYKLVKSRGDVKREHRKGARFSLRNWTSRQETASLQRAMYWRERGDMRSHAPSSQKKQKASFDHSQNAYVTRVYFRDYLVESHKKRPLRMSTEPSTYNTFSTRKLVVRSRRPVAEPSELLASHILHVWFDRHRVLKIVD